MTSFRRFAVLAAGGLLSAVAVAQIDAAQDRAEGVPAKPAAPVTVDPTAERAEDVEVLRRILNKSLGLPNKATATQQNWVPAQPSGFGGFGGGIQGGIGGIGGIQGGIGGFGGHGLGGGFSGHGIGGHGFGGTAQPLVNLNTLNTGVVTQPNIGPLDGVYLAGHGVVFTLHVPEQLGFWLRPPDRSAGLADFCMKCHATEPTSRSNLEPVARAGKPASEWDRVRDELQGKKPEAKQQQPAAAASVNVCEPGKTADRLVSKLAQNARHVRHLPADERVTVVVTFDGVTGSARIRQVLSGPVSGEAEDKGAPVPRGFTAEEAKQLTLGDLHLKQNKPKDAVAAYMRGLSRFKDKDLVARVAPQPGLTPAQQGEFASELQKGVRDAYAKMAQAWLAAGDTDKAQTALDVARKFKVEVADPDTAPEKSLPVPAKLVVSVARADLDKAGDDLTALRKAVRVELTGFPPADKKK